LNSLIPVFTPIKTSAPQRGLLLDLTAFIWSVITLEALKLLYIPVVSFLEL